MKKLVRKFGLVRGYMYSTVSAFVSLTFEQLIRERCGGRVEVDSEDVEQKGQSTVLERGVV